MMGSTHTLAEIRCTPTPFDSFMERADQSRSSSRILRRLSRPGFAQSRGTASWAWVILAVGIGVTVGTFFLVRRYERDVKRREFMTSASHLAMVTETHFHFPLEVFRSLPAFFASSEDVTRDEFRTFVQGALERHAGIYAFQWIPVVSDEQRAAVVQAARADGEAGFEIREHNAEGGMIVAKQRSRYMPIMYEEPRRRKLGIDLNQDASIQRAINDRELVVSPRRRLPDVDDDAYGVVLYHPIFEPRPDSESGFVCRGVVAVVLRVQPIMHRVLESGYLEETSSVLSDSSAAPDARLLFESYRGVSLEPQSKDFAKSHSFPMANREWTIFLNAKPDSIWLSRPISWIVLGCGAALSMLAAIVTLGLGTIYGLKKRVEAAVQLGQYRLEEKIGEGGMGRVYRASHAMLRRPTAVKLLRPEDSSHTAIERFEREVQITSQLVHPNTIVIFDYGRTPEGVFYYAMEYLDGVDLGGVVRCSGALSEGRVIHVLRQVCGSLNEAHRAGMVHRDIKPRNIMLCHRGGLADVIKVLDFGLVKDVSQHGADVTQANMITGTPLYMSPEAIDSANAVDARSDLYALGAVGYFLLTAGPVFDVQSPIQVMHCHLHTTPKAPSIRVGREISSDLEQLIMRCLEKNPARRPQTAEDLSDLLGQCQAANDWDQPRAREWWQQFEAQFKADAKPNLDAATRFPVETSVEVDLAGRQI